jgi:hypothetical protein
MLVAHYEGEHDHAKCARSEFVCDDASTSQPGAPDSLPCSISFGSLRRMITPGLAANQASTGSNEEKVVRQMVTPEFRKVLVDELVNFLKNDSEFMESLTSAVTARMMEKISDRII